MERAASPHMRLDDTTLSRGGLLLCFVVFGVAVVATYVQLYVRWRGWDAARQRAVWACYADGGLAFGAWACSAALAAAGFCAFTLVLLCWVAPPDDGVLYPYASFLLASACYAPLLLMIEARRVAREADLVLCVDDWSVGFLRWMVLFVLFRAAMAAWWLLLWSAVHLGWRDAGAIVANVCALWLAVHCTAFDLLAWGWSWFCEEEEDDRALVIWPRIDPRDI